MLSERARQPLSALRIRDRIHQVADKAFERLVLHELLVDLRVVLQQVLHHLGQCLVVRHTRGVRGVFLRILVGRVGGDFRRDVFADAFGHPNRLTTQDYLRDLLIERAGIDEQDITLFRGINNGARMRHSRAGARKWSRRSPHTCIPVRVSPCAWRWCWIVSATRRGTATA